MPRAIHKVIHRFCGYQFREIRLRNTCVAVIDACAIFVDDRRVSFCGRSAPIGSRANSRSLLVADLRLRCAMTADRKRAQGSGVHQHRSFFRLRARVGAQPRELFRVVTPMLCDKLPSRPLRRARRCRCRRRVHGKILQKADTRARPRSVTSLFSFSSRASGSCRPRPLS